MLRDLRCFRRVEKTGCFTNVDRTVHLSLKAIEPPVSIQGSMEKQMRADRDKRAAILSAEGAKQSAILQAEGRKEAAFRDAEARERSAAAEAQATKVVSDAIEGGSWTLPEAK